jgi:hypothetical protein
MAEMWCTIPSFPDYEASSLGFIRNKMTLKNIKFFFNGGYAQMHLYKNSNRHALKLHRLIAEAFCENPENKATVNHKNKDTTDNRAANLEWATQQENNDHKVLHNFNRKEVITRCIWKCTKDTHERLEKFKDTTEASRKIDINNCKTIASNIRLVLCGKYKSSNGFFWEYEDFQEVEGETWKEIDSTLIGCQGYTISSHGRLRNSTNILFEGHKNTQGYIRVCVNKKLYRMHVLVAKAFHENPEDKPHVNHKDGNRSNNHFQNLEWCTRSENMKHAYDTGLNSRTKKIR